MVYFEKGIRINSDAFFITHTYEANNGNLEQSVYGNGVTYKPEYDSLDRIVSASYNGVKQYTLSYGADGRIGLYNDLAAGVTWRYEYAKDGSVTSAICSNGTRLYYTYDTATGKLLSCKVYDGSTSKTTSYTYHEATDSNGKKNLIDYVTLPNNAVVDYDYDGFYRASYDIEVGGNAKVSTDYTFRAGSASGSTSMMVAGLTNTTANGWSNTLSYTYDASGNIETIKENGTQIVKYYYDALNQLVREDNKRAAKDSNGNWVQKTIVYTYDKGGNILSVTDYDYTTNAVSGNTPTNVYEYTDSNWKDLLKSYNDKDIVYDNIGNRTSYNGYTYTWENGRQLAGISGNNNTITYKYNSDGIRTQKTVNGVTTKYTLEGNSVVKETNGTDTLWFYYDATGSVIGFDYYPENAVNAITYFYIKNLQGDIIAISDVHGNIAGKYVYDSWGKLISCVDCDGRPNVNISELNPYRYRGYRYDTETGLYYLNSRYYDPEMKRFINADAFTSTGQGILGNNMFAYCQNNPIMFVDDTGAFIGAFIAGAACVALSGVIGGAISVCSGGTFWGGFASAATAAAITAIGIAFAPASIGFAGSMALGAVSGSVGSMAGYGAQCLVDGTAFNGTHFATRAVTGAVFGAFAGGLSHHLPSETFTEQIVTTYVTELQFQSMTEGTNAVIDTIVSSNTSNTPTSPTNISQSYSNLSAKAPRGISVISMA